MSGRFGTLLGWGLLVVLLLLYGAAGRFAPYGVLALGLIAIPYLVYVRAGRPLVPDIPAAGFLAAIALLGVAYAFAAQQPSDVLIAVNFAWLLLFIPIQSLLQRLPRLSPGQTIGRLALGGLVLLLLLALYQRLALDVARIGTLTSDPIRIANIAVVLGFVSLVGVLDDRSRGRWVYLAGPVLAVGVAYLAGTRGAIVSAVVIAAISTLFLVRRPRLAVAGAVAVVAILALGLSVAAQLHVPRVDTLVQTLQQIVSGQTVTDLSVHTRLEMGRTAWSAFLDSPLYGHGWQRLIAAVTPYLGADEKDLFLNQPHLHSDILNFAVAGGLLGVVAYGLMLFAPLVAAIVSVRDRFYRVRLFGIVVLTASYAVLGATTLMFGFETPTALFAGLASILLGFCRESDALEVEAAHPPLPMRPPGRFETGIVWATLGLVLVISPLLGLVTPYVVVAVGLSVWVVLLLRGRLLEGYAMPAGRLWLIAFGLLALVFALTAKDVGDVLFVFNFTMLLLGGPFMLLFARTAVPSGLGRVAWLAAIGIGLTLLMVLYFTLVGSVRPAGFIIGPIVLSNAVLALAVVATMGAIGLRSRISLLLPLALVAAVIITLLTQSRGPLLAVVPLLLLTGIFLWRARFRRNGWFVALGALAAVGLVVGAMLVGGGRVTHLPRILGGFFGGETVSDNTADIRLALYRAGWHAFLDAPWIGHGWARLMAAPMPYIDPQFLVIARKLPQLHNDVLNFAVAGGIPGVALYLVILLTPLIAALRSPRDSLRLARIYGTSALATVYAFGGLTDLMFGHEFHTMLFVMLNAIILAFCRDPAPAATPAR